MCTVRLHSCIAELPLGFPCCWLWLLHQCQWEDLILNRWSPLDWFSARRAGPNIPFACPLTCIESLCEALVTENMTYRNGISKMPPGSTLPCGVVPQCVTVMFVKRSKQIMQFRSFSLTGLSLSSLCFLTSSWRSRSSTSLSAASCSSSSSTSSTFSITLDLRGFLALGESSTLIVACDRL